eukprot:356673-Chlamydomonas_euryale.AAC.1
MHARTAPRRRHAARSANTAAATRKSSTTGAGARAADAERTARAAATASAPRSGTPDWPRARSSFASSRWIHTCRAANIHTRAGDATAQVGSGGSGRRAGKPFFCRLAQTRALAGLCQRSHMKSVYGRRGPRRMADSFARPHTRRTQSHLSTCLTGRPTACRMHPFPPAPACLSTRLTDRPTTCLMHSPPFAC